MFEKEKRCICPPGSSTSIFFAMARALSGGRDNIDLEKFILEESVKGFVDLKNFIKN